MRSKHLLTLLQDLRLSSNLPHSTNNLLISIHKTAYRVWNLDVLTKLSKNMLRLAQIIARNPRKQVMNSLELQLHGQSTSIVVPSIFCANDT